MVEIFLARNKKEIHKVINEKTIFYVTIQKCRQSKNLMEASV